MEIRYARAAKRRQRCRRVRRDERHQRLAGTRALDDRPHRRLRLRPRRRADDHEQQVEFRRRQENVECGFHGVVARAGDGEVDHPCGLHVDAGCGEPRQSLGACRLDVDAATRERIDHHGGAARGRRHHADALAPAGSSRHPREQRQTLEQAVEGIDPGNAAGAEKDVGDVVLARERARVGHRELARSG
jgi:hypothetical protein